MELFITSLTIILLGVICIFLMPRLTPYTLGLMAVVLFALGIWQHREMFPYEYKSVNTAEMLKSFSPFIMVLGTIVGGMILVNIAYGGNPPPIANIVPNLPAMPNMPAIPNLPAMPNIMPNVNAPANNTNVRPNNARPNNARPNNARPNNTRPNNARPNNARPNNARPNNARSNNGENLASRSFKVV